MYPTRTGETSPSATSQVRPRLLPRRRLFAILPPTTTLPCTDDAPRPPLTRAVVSRPTMTRSLRQTHRHRHSSAAIPEHPSVAHAASYVQSPASLHEPRVY